MTLFLAVLLCIILSIPPSVAQETPTAEECFCVSCHDADIHGNFSHASAPGSGTVVIFADTDHDDAAWHGSTPYFGILVDCAICHTSELPAIHGKDCATCHPKPYDTLETWNKGCQQGGCHPTFHDDSTKAHLPFEDPYDTSNNCDSCHDPGMAVPQTECRNCHAGYGTWDVTPPVTTSNAKATYIGPAKISFSISDNGKVGVGRTFYRLDGGAATAAGKYLLTDIPGEHELEFWSMDQSGNTEATHRVVRFGVEADTIPPTTDSNAQPAYNQSATITLSATDNGTLGVKQTFYSLDNGPQTAGTIIIVPGTSGTVSHTLIFWSEDWSGNIESAKTVSFTVTSGTGTIRIIWGDSDVSGSPCNDDPEATASWTIRRGGWSGPVVASGSDGCPNWNGVNNIDVSIGATPYFVIIDWWDSYYDWFDQTAHGNVYVTTPGQVVPLNY